jgi:hypothetical protein
MKRGDYDFRVFLTRLYPLEAHLSRAPSVSRALSVASSQVAIW